MAPASTPEHEPVTSWLSALQTATDLSWDQRQLLSELGRFLVGRRGTRLQMSPGAYAVIYHWRSIDEIREAALAALRGGWLSFSTDAEGRPHWEPSTPWGQSVTDDQEQLLAAA